MSPFNLVKGKVANTLSMVKTKMVMIILERVIIFGLMVLDFQLTNYLVVIIYQDIYLTIINSKTPSTFVLGVNYL
jgi:hypothetical protein